MLDKFLQNIERKSLIKPEQKVLLAISGGIDSMVMLHLFEKSDFEFGIVHCNFQLRGKESDGDEQFVRDEVLKHDAPVFFETFDTEEYARLSGISIEMAARELRYAYFERIRKENGFDLIATAHHQDDLIETFFLNLSRKTGIKGLTGIKEKSGCIIRPLLFAGREEIETYAAKNYIDYREDSSNREVVYQRNFVRHKILPLFSELNPSFKKNFLASVDNLKAAESVYLGYVQEAKQQVVKSNAPQLEISIRKLLNSKHPKTLLLEILAEYGFNPTVIEEVFSSLNRDSGKQFFSKSHRLVKDRENLYLSEIKETQTTTFYLEEEDENLATPLQVKVEKMDADGFEIIKKSHVACIDLHKVEFPLLIRKWQKGDYFQPLGMTGFKKVSDFFIDQKMPIHEKENTWLLCSGKKIVWIMGHRLDNRFKVTAETDKVLKIEILLNSN